MTLNFPRTSVPSFLSLFNWMPLHPFHMTSASPSPIMASAAVLTILSSAVMWFNHVDHGGTLLLLGIASVFIVTGFLFKSITTKITDFILNFVCNVKWAGFGFFFMSPTETFSFQPLYLIFAIIFIIFTYLIYLKISNQKSLFELWSFIFINLKNGFYASVGWWVYFSSSWLGTFIRWVGCFCFIIMRSVIPYYPSINLMVNTYLIFEYSIYFISILYTLYILVFALCTIYSTFKYVLNFGFLVQNSPISLAGTLFRLAGVLVKFIVGAVAALVILANVVISIDEAQKKIFHASHDQLLTTKLRTFVDAGKEASGYNARKSKSE